MKTVIWAAVLCLWSTSSAAERFSFMAVGDTAYAGDESVAAYHRLIDAINETDIAFSIHVGDIWGASVCVEERYREVLNSFNRYLQPVVFTPGDNEWTDCTRHAYGDWDNPTRLDILRHVYYPDGNSLGKNKLELVRQADVSANTKFVENSRWLHNNVLFLTLNIPGSNNNLLIDRRESLLEAHERNAANIAWLRDSFRIAREQAYSAAVLAFHAELFEGTGGSRVSPAYTSIVNEMKLAAELYENPILLVHGDQHRFTIDRPFSTFGTGKLNLGNVVRLQVFGDPEIRGVQVTVDTSTPWVFGYEPFYLE